MFVYLLNSFIIILLSISTSLALNVSNFSGTGTAAFSDGDANTARFNNPRGTAVDSAGNVYVADTTNNRIRKIDPDGNTSTLAGTGAAGFTDGAGAIAQFNQPRGVAVDSADNIYVADSINDVIRKILPDGTVSTLAGTGVAGFADGAAGVAQFNTPNGVAVDTNDVIYVADTTNRRIRTVQQDGTTATLAGDGTAGFIDGPGATARFNNPRGLDLSSDDGTIYVADTSNHSIRAVDVATGIVSTFAGTGAAGFADGNGINASFNLPETVAVDSNDNVFVADNSNNRIRQITAAGLVSTLAGTGIAGFLDGDETIARFFAPQGLSVDADDNLYVGDTSNHRIRKIEDLDDGQAPPPAPPVNNPPVIQFINAPADNAFEVGEVFILQAFAFDIEDADISEQIRWTSSLDGLIDIDNTIDFADLSVGTHVITAAITDSDASTAEIDLVISIVDIPEPLIEILKPSKTRLRARHVKFEGQAFAVINNQLEDVSDEIVWSSNINGVLGTGAKIKARLSRGEHVISARVDGFVETIEIRLRRRRR